MKFFVPALMSFALMYIMTPVVVYLSKKFHCLDVPGKRKFHCVATPRWGGIAMFLTVIVVMLLSVDLDKAMVSYICASLVIVIVGILDDWRPLGWIIKMGAIMAAVTMVVFGGDTVVRSIGVYESRGTLELGSWSVPFTYFGMIGLTNAINLIDGLNGLAAGTSLLGFLFFAIAAAISGNYHLAVMSMAFIGVLVAFLPYNFPKARTFMGDSGSLFLGFSLAFFSIHLTQNARFPVDPMYPFMVLLLPIFDTMRVMINRMLNLRNPFKADKSHLHHLFVRRKFTQTNTVMLLWLISIIFGVGALMMMPRTSVYFLYVAIFGMLFLGMAAELLVRVKSRKRPQTVRPPLTFRQSFFLSAAVANVHVPEAAQGMDRALAKNAYTQSNLVSRNTHDTAGSFKGAEKTASDLTVTDYS